MAVKIIKYAMELLYLKHLREHTWFSSAKWESNRESDATICTEPQLGMHEDAKVANLERIHIYKHNNFLIILLFFSLVGVFF